MTQPQGSTDGAKPDAKDAGTGGDANGSKPDGKPQDKSTPESKVVDAGDDLTKLQKALQAERKRADALEKEKKDAELAKLPELERYKAENAELKTQNEKLSRDLMKFTVGIAEKIPLHLIKRLQGDTEEEMRADAKDILKGYTPQDGEDPSTGGRKPPTTTNDGRGSKGSNSSGGGIGMNEAIRIAAGLR